MDSVHKESAAVPLVPMANSLRDPSVPWTVNDLFKSDKSLYMLYHCMSCGYDTMTPVGSLVGALVLPNTFAFSHLTRLQAAGTGSIMGGCAGMGIGVLALASTASSTNPKIPWNDVGIHMRVSGLAHNYRTRAMDLGAWVGVSVTGGAMLYVGGPERLGFSKGPYGGLQAMALGSAVGSMGASLIVDLTK